MADVGLSIIEGLATGQVGFKEPSKRNIGLLGQFVRGRELVPTLITSLEEFNNNFGGQSSLFYGPRIVKSIFDEAGEATPTLYIARVVGADSVCANGSATLTGDAVMSVRAGYKGSDDKGAWANGAKAVLYSFGSKVKDMFTLEISYMGTTETYHYDTLAQIQGAVNKVSKFMTVSFSAEIEKTSYTDLVGTITTTLDRNVVTGVGTAFTTALEVGNVICDDSGKIIGTVAAITSATSLTLLSKAMVAVSAASAKVRNDAMYEATLAGGVDGDVVESDFYPEANSLNPKGLDCMKGYDVQIVACTEFHSLSMAKVMNQFVNDLKGPIGVINLPLNADEGTAELYALELQTNGISFMAGAYLGWSKVADEMGNAVVIPILGQVLGAGYLRTPYIQGDFIHIPPAGVDSVFTNVLDVIPERIEQGSINRMVQQFSCNVIQYTEGLGYYVGSSRTYSTNSLYQSIHIRLQTSYYLRLLAVSLKFMEQKPNTPELKREALVELDTFFRNEYNNGALERSVPFSTAYKGICDQSNNPAGQDRKLINIDVLWIPTECTESIQVALRRNDSVLTTSEV